MIFLENEILYGQSFPVPKLDDFVLPIGKARIARAGKDVTIVSFSMGMSYALKAAEELAKDGIEAEVIDLRTLRPMDTDTIVESVKKTGRIVTVEEGWPQAGIGAEIAARVIEHAFDYLDAPVTRVSGKDVPMPYAANLEKLALPIGRRRGRGGESGLLPVTARSWPTATTIRGSIRRWRCPSRRSRTAAWKSCVSASSTTSFMSRRLPAFKDVGQWGEVLAEVARRLGAIYAAQNDRTLNKKRRHHRTSPKRSSPTSARVPVKAAAKKLAKKPAKKPAKKAAKKPARKKR